MANAFQVLKSSFDQMGPRLTLVIPQAEKGTTNKETESNQGESVYWGNIIPHWRGCMYLSV